MAYSKKSNGIVAAAAALLFFTSPLTAAKLTWLEQIEVNTFGELRQVERYQLKTAERFYTKGEYAAAAAEYEKFITLYETSAGAPYAQLMWSHCQVKQRKVYTGIRDGFQTVIDYWPESAEAMLASYLIGQSYKSIGELKKAEIAYGKAVNSHPEKHIAVLSKWDIAEIAKIQNNEKRLIQVWTDLVFKSKQDKKNLPYLTKAAQSLAKHHFAKPDFDDALKTLVQMFKEHDLSDAIYQNSKDAVSSLCKSDNTKVAGEKLADQVIGIIMDESIEANEEELPELFRRMARIHERSGRDLEIIKTYEALAKRIGMSDAIRASLAGWHCKMKRYPKAREIYASFDNKIDGLKHIASTWIHQKQPDQAIRIYDRLAKLAPDKLPEWRQAVAEIYSSIGEHDKAIEVYRELITLAPSQAGKWHWTIGGIYEGTKRLKLAIRAYRQSDNYPKAYFQMAKCHRNLNEFTEALTLYHQALATESAAPDATLAIGYTYEEQENKKNAIKWFQRTCKLFPRSRNASRAHAHLQKEYGISVTLGGSKEK